MTRILHLLLTLSLVVLPMRAVMADFSVMPMAAEMGAEIQVADHHAGNQSHHEMPMGESMQMDASSTDCHDHNMMDCEACALHFTLKKDIDVSGLFITPNLYTDYNVPVVTLVLPSDIRPPIA
ncbi:MAG: hypothetical protein V3R49_01720 [Gammaproteobacteria bacterium]